MRALKPSNSILYWSSFRAVISTVRSGNIKLKDRDAMSVLVHFCRNIEVPRIFDEVGSGEEARRISVQEVKSKTWSLSAAQAIDLVNGAFQAKLRPSDATYSIRCLLLEYLRLGCLMTVIPFRNRAAKQRTRKSLELLHPVAGINVLDFFGMTSLLFGLFFIDEGGNIVTPFMEQGLM